MAETGGRAGPLSVLGVRVLYSDTDNMSIIYYTF